LSETPKRAKVGVEQSFFSRNNPVSPRSRVTMSAEDDTVDSNPRRGAPKDVSLPRELPTPCLSQPSPFDEVEESAASDYWSSPMGRAALADWEEDED